MKVTDILKAIHKGARIANEKYEDWSNGNWITDNGVEGWLVGCIAEAIHERQKTHESLLLEVSFRNIKKWSEARLRRGRRRLLSKGRKRADIVLLNRNEQPICVIEIKRR